MENIPISNVSIIYNNKKTRELHLPNSPPPLFKARTPMQGRIVFSFI